jgi:CRISP-associated protein Cas1
MSALPIIADPEPRRLPDYLPARMVNEFVYCPRLFFYEWVEGVFRESADTIEGSIQHRRADAGSGELAGPEQGEPIHARSVTLASERLRVIAKMDLVEGDGEGVVPVDYKRGKPRETKEGIELWPSDRVQVAIQALILRENGYQCDEGVVFYRTTRQRARVVVDDALVRETEEAIAAAWQTARSGEMPPPLIDSPKCPGCSLAGICLPDETVSLAALDDAEQLALFAIRETVPRKPPGAVRRLVTPRSDLRPLYLNKQGVRVGKSGAVLQVREKDALIQEVRIGEICQLNLMGNVQLSTQAVQGLCEAEVPIAYFSMGGWFYGMTTGLNVKNVFLRQAQFRLSDTEWFPLKVARALVAGKVRNQRTMLQRNHVEPRAQDLLELRRMAERAEEAGSSEELLGLEGNAARVYFSAFGGMLKSEDGGAAPEGFSFDFEGRNRRPPRDPVNALLSLAYSLLTKDFTIACYAVGFDPYMGFYHKPRFGRPALALDMMEPFRPLIGDSAALTAINTRMVTERDFVKAGPSVALTASGRKGFFRAYEMRMDTLITHPLFDYRVSYRRLLEIEARLLARAVTGEVGSYRAFTTR